MSAVTVGVVGATRQVGAGIRPRREDAPGLELGKIRVFAASRSAGKTGQ